LSTTQDFQEIKQRADRISKKNESFSNPMRVLVVSIVLAKEEISWSQLKEILEKIVEIGVNPNTLSFHITKLVELGYLEKGGTKEQPLYRIVKEKEKEIAVYIDPLLIEAIRKKVM
jgi:DNA-binding transcriptional ArsR family regulator